MIVTAPLSIEQRALRMAARIAVADAVRAGQLKRQPCERCGNVPAQGHHDDYSKPLSVRWLCQQHHREVHRAMGTLGGRRLRAGAPTKLVGIRATDAERAAWERAAKAEGCATLSAWLIKTANNRSARVLRGGKAR